MRKVLASHFQGKRLNSPNDVVVKSDGSVWFTDPTYGIDTEYEGYSAESEIGASYVYPIDPGDGSVTAVVTDMFKPNGLAFSSDEGLLYVADTGVTHDPSLAPVIRVFPVRPGGHTNRRCPMKDGPTAIGMSLCSARGRPTNRPKCRKSWQPGGLIS